MPTQAGQPPFTIKVGKLRGVESQGMMCSAKELGLSEDAEGLLILPSDARVGVGLAEHLGRAAGDVIYDLEITPNRPDLNSIIGIAREISAATGNPLRIPEVRLEESSERVEQHVAVRIDDSEACPRYTARLVRGVKIGPSPDWLKTSLERVGIRSINNVVDVTNFVMLESGQPLHAFDFHLLARSSSKAEIVVRKAAPGEKFVTLDGQERQLAPETLLIADVEKATALAGIMGGQNSEIQSTTSDVLIESAYFQPQNIRRSSKRLELRTDASYRFERGADPGITEWASRRAAQLIVHVAGGTLVAGVVDAYPQPAAERSVSLRFAKIEQLLGIPIPAAASVEFLQRLGLTLVKQDQTSAEFRIPSFRVDLKREVDLIEEIARLHGIEKIPATPPRGAIGSNSFDATYDVLTELRRVLTALGCSEAQGQTLISDQAARLAANEFVELANPLSSEMNVLRPSLLPGLLDSLRHNISRKSYEVALFEIGRVFLKQPNNQFSEQRRVAVALTGARNPLFWSGADREAVFDIYDAKGLLESLLEQFGVRGTSISQRAEPTALFLVSGTLLLGKQPIGEIGQVLPTLARRYDLRDPVFLLELNLDLLLARRNADRSFKALPAFPTIRRDIAMLAPETLTHEAVLSTVKSAKPQFLEKVELFDVFRGKNVPEGQKSMAYAFTYRNPERTLTDAEVNGVHEKLTQTLQQQLKVSLRQ
jgi:phenylalanyl-tRNA synthetase beta chain